MLNNFKSAVCNIALFLIVAYVAASLAVSVALAVYPENAGYIVAHRNSLMLIGNYE